jgi:hypothetical protein
MPWSVRCVVVCPAWRGLNGRRGGGRYLSLSRRGRFPRHFLPLAPFVCQRMRRGHLARNLLSIAPVSHLTVLCSRRCSESDRYRTRILPPCVSALGPIADPRISSAAWARQSRTSKCQPSSRCRRAGSNDRRRVSTRLVPESPVASTGIRTRSPVRHFMCCMRDAHRRARIHLPQACDVVDVRRFIDFTPIGLCATAHRRSPAAQSPYD